MQLLHVQHIFVVVPSIVNSKTIFAVLLLHEVISILLQLFYFIKTFAIFTHSFIHSSIESFTCLVFVVVDGLIAVYCAVLSNSDLYDSWVFLQAFLMVLATFVWLELLQWRR